MRPGFRKPEDDVARRVEEKVKTEVDSKIKTEVDKRVSEILKEREDKEKVQKAEKLKTAVDVAKAIKGESEKEKAEKENKEKDDLLCPTCHIGHLHKMEQSGLSVKCVGDKCGREYVLLDTQADYQCKNCGIPIKKPDDPKSIDSCPYCGSKKAVKFDWSKVRDVTRNVGR